MNARNALTRASPAVLAAVVFGAVAIGFTAWYFTGASETAKTWIPNVATAAVGLVLTVTLVQWIIRREEARRREPRVTRALMHIQAEWVTFVQAVAIDYLATHTNAKPLPANAIDVLQLWIDEQDSADLPHPSGLTARDGTLCDAGFEFVDEVDQYDARDRDMLEPDLVAAIRDLYAAGKAARFWLNRKLPPGMPEQLAAVSDPQRRAYRRVVEGARTFGPGLRRYASPVVFVFDPDPTIVELGEALRADASAGDGNA